MNAVEIRGLSKTFRSGWRGRHETRALCDVTLTVAAGSITGILGPNGAGKTTLLSILATLLLPDAGAVTVLGHDVLRRPEAVRPRLNMASGHASFAWSLTVEEILDFYARLYGLTGRTRRRRVAETIALCELGPRRAVQYNRLSTGMKQRLSLARALLNEPEVLLLDEPTVGLDPDIAIRIREQVARLRRERGTTILLCTHYMAEAEQLCDEIAFLREGAIVARGTPGELRRRARGGEVIRVRGEGGWPLERLGALPGLLGLRAAGETLEARVDEGARRLHELLRVLQRDGTVIRDVRIEAPDLEEVFVELAK
jgi:ABC-2 type transport system ATP-binding protein